MNAKQIRQNAISATRGQLRFCGVEPKTANKFQIELALNEASPAFARNASDNQFKMFMRDFKRWQNQ